METRLTPWQRNIVGPFRLLCRLKGEVFPELPGLRIGEDLGKVYSAVCRSNGQRALVVVPTVAPRAAWSVKVQSSVTPIPFLSVEVEQAPEVAEPLEALAEGLDAVTCALEDLGLREDAARHLVARPVRPRRARRAQRLAGAAGAVGLLAACAAAGVTWWPAFPGPAPADVPQLLTASLGESAMDAAPDLKAMRPERRMYVAGDDLPQKGQKGQARPNKEGKCQRFEEAIYGLCWLKLAGDAPCGPTAYEYKGACYRPIMEEPTSERGKPPGPGPLTSAE